jgi:hypothetical protein
VIYPIDPGYKGTDTSFDAAESMKVNAGTLRKYVIEELKVSPAGLTADECADRLRESILSIRPRFSELRNFGLIQDSGKRGLNRSGKHAIVWILKTEQNDD